MAVYFTWRLYITEHWNNYVVSSVFPGSHSIEFQKNGVYLILYEYETSMGDKNYSSSPNITDLWMDIGGAFRTTVPLKLRASKGIEVGDRIVELVSVFQVTQPQRIQFSARYRSWKSKPEFVLSIMPSEMMETFI